MAGLAVLYEHPRWFQPLFSELRRWGIGYQEWRADNLCFGLDETEWPDLVLNRMSASAAFRGHGHGQFAVRALLAVLEARRVAVINGAAAYEYEISKVAQLELFRRAGARVPRTRVINRPALAARAAQGWAFPVLVKPNCGGAGRGVARFDSMKELEERAESIEFGSDHTALIQEYVPSRDGACYRLEVLGGEILYALRIQREGAGYDLCPADACESAAKPVFTRCEPPAEAAVRALNIARQGRLDLCGIEYMIDHRTGEPVFYDLNALSNFVADAEQVVGFNPYERLAAYIARRLAALARVR